MAKKHSLFPVLYITTTAATEMKGCAYLEEMLFNVMKLSINSESILCQRKLGNITFVPERRLFQNWVKYLVPYKVHVNIDMKHL